MKICFTNHYETDLDADIYVGCLPYDRPIIRPQFPGRTSQCIVFPLRERPTGEEQRKSNLHLPHDAKHTLGSPSSRVQLRQEDHADFYWQHSALDTLTNHLINPPNNPPHNRHQTKTTWFLASFGEHRKNLGVWIFKNTNPVIFIPLGTACSMVVDLNQLPSWKASKDFMLLTTLSNYVELWRQKKLIFNINILNKQALLIMALIRALAGKTLLYGFSEKNDVYEHLKFFDFLTHDLPSNPQINISDLLIECEFVVNHLNLSKAISKKSSRYIEKYFPGSLSELASSTN